MINLIESSVTDIIKIQYVDDGEVPEYRVLLLDKSSGSEMLFNKIATISVRDGSSHVWSSSTLTPKEAILIGQIAQVLQDWEDGNVGY